MESRLEYCPGEPRRRVVMLGASNLTRGISTAVETAQRIWNEPLSVWIAAGHGRSYGAPSSVLGRRLPGIVECGLWRSLSAGPAAPTFALLTDIGNDLIYGSSVEVVFRWVETCVERLSNAGARIVMTGLPVARLEDRPHWQFELLKRLFFPSRELRYEDVIERAHELDVRLRTLAGERNVARVLPNAAWYGWDPIHIRMCHWRVAWREILTPWSNSEKKFLPAQGSLRRWIYLRRLCPEEREWLGRAQRRSQPCGRLADGTTIRLY